MHIFISPWLEWCQRHSVFGLSIYVWSYTEILLSC